MNDILIQLAMAIVATIVLLGALAAILTFAGRLPWFGRRLSDALARPPLLDLAIALLTWVPWLAGGLIWGWVGFGGALLGQVAVLYGWIFLHEAMHRRATKGPRLVKVHNRLVGPWRNQLSLGLTVVGVPVLWVVRLPQIFAYPVLVWLLGFPRYRHGDWVNLTRHKFQDLVGHDLVWCLYCDWMTGVWSLGSEMLRNVESFWCPIRFANEKKNEHARIAAARETNRRQEDHSSRSISTSGKFSSASGSARFIPMRVMTQKSSMAHPKIRYWP